MSLGARIRDLRQRNDFSLQQLADRAGISKTYLWQLENDEAEQPSARILLKIAKALQTTIAYLLEQPAVRADAGEVEIPPSLREFFEANPNIPAVDRRMLASIQYRGRQPRSPRDWEFIYEAIKRATQR